MQTESFSGSSRDLLPLDPTHSFDWHKTGRGSCVSCLRASDCEFRPTLEVALPDRLSSNHHSSRGDDDCQS